jgi:hypothetical protein
MAVLMRFDVDLTRFCEHIMFTQSSRAHSLRTQRLLNDALGASYSMSRCKSLGC